jgi:hypothetical protein
MRVSYDNGIKVSVATNQAELQQRYNEEQQRQLILREQQLQKEQNHA